MLRIKADRFEDEGFGDVELGEVQQQYEQELLDDQNYMAGVHMLNRLGFKNWKGIVKDLHDSIKNRKEYPANYEGYARHHPSIKELAKEFQEPNSPFNSPLFNEEHNISDETHKIAREFMNPQTKKFDKKVEEKAKADPELMRDMKTTKEVYVAKPSRHQDKQLQMDFKQEPQVKKEPERAPAEYRMPDLPEEDMRILEQYDNMEDPRTRRQYREPEPEDDIDEGNDSWWDSLTPEQQQAYKKAHPNTKYK